MKMTFVTRTLAVCALLLGLGVTMNAQSNGYENTTAATVKAPSTEPVSLEFPKVKGEPFVVIRGDRVARVDFIDSKQEMAFSWKDTTGKGLYKVIVRVGSLPADVYHVKVTYGDQKTYTYIVRTDGELF